MTLTYEVAIVGGGAAGSSLATVLARAGRLVIVIERGERFRDRIRFQGIHPRRGTLAGAIVAENIVVIGDAAGANDPSIGNGLSLVFRDVHVLCNLLSTEEDY